MDKVADDRSFAQLAPIWAHADVPARHEVVLLRHRVDTDRLVTGAELRLFADTRYEIWLNGRWLGRGPARFSGTRREFDVYALGDIITGTHVIAVLAQWSPSIRRAESVDPGVMAQLTGVIDGAQFIIAASGPHWRARRSTAWRADAAPVHAQGLIGATELLDLRELPRDWMQPGFDDAAWAQAVVRATTTAHYSPSNIPPRIEAPFTPAVIDAGLLSPNRTLVDTGTDVARRLEFSTDQTANITIEAIAADKGLIMLNGATLDWTGAGNARPGVVHATIAATSGTHAIEMAGASSRGLTVAVSPPVKINHVAQPVQQGAHAGRRVLLAEPQADWSAVDVVAGDGLALAFPAHPAYTVLDLGRVRYGRLIGDLLAAPGMVLDVGWDERLWPGTLRPLPFPGDLHPEWNQVDSWVADGSVRHFTTIDARAGRYILIASWGASTLMNLRMVEERYAATQKGQFDSSDAMLNRIWQIGVDTVVANMTDAYADPWRERGQWWGDAYINDHVNRVAFGDAALLRRGLLFMGDAVIEGHVQSLAPNGAGHYILDYGMLWVQSIADYWRATRDGAVLDAVYPKVIDFLEHLKSMEHPNTHLLVIPNEHWTLSALIDFPAYYCDIGTGGVGTAGQSTAVNAMYYGTLRDAVVIFEVAGDRAKAQEFEQRARVVQAAINRELYDSARGRYHSTIYEQRIGIPTPHAQAWPLAYGVTPHDQRHRVADSLVELLASGAAPPNVGTYGMFWVLEGLAEADRLDVALQLVRTHYGRLISRGATTWWESFTAGDDYRQALSHGWGSAPTWFLTTRILGLRATSPETWEARPAPWAMPLGRGGMPLAGGLLSIEWRYAKCANISMKLNAPTGASGALLWPSGWVLNQRANLTLDGIPIWSNGGPLTDTLQIVDDTLRVPLEGGVHELISEGPCTDLILPFISR